MLNNKTLPPYSSHDYSSCLQKRFDTVHKVKHLFFFVIRRAPLGVTRELFTQLLTLNDSIGHLGVTSFACFQAHNMGLSKNVTISPKLGSDPELSIGLSWVIVTNQACGQQDHQEMFAIWKWSQHGGSLLTHLSALTQGGALELFIHVLANAFLPFIGSSGLWAASRSHKSFWVGLLQDSVQ